MNNSPNFLESCEMLGLNPDELMLSPTLSDNTPDNVRKRIKQLNAATKLSVCMMAWNKIDGFEPDEKANWKDDNAGYAPYFLLKDGKLLSSGLPATGAYTGIVAATTYYAGSFTTIYFGLRLPLKTRDRAIEFSEKFIDTFNELV